MDRKQQLQEVQYSFPYHYLPRFENDNFSEAVVLRWGYEYLSYVFYVLELLQERDFSSLLDVGCGDGRFIREARWFFPEKELVGVDYSEHAVALARAMNPPGHYMQGDIMNPDLFDKVFDVLTLIEVLEHIPPPSISAFVEGLHQHTSENGILIITVPSTNIKLNSKHYQHFDIETLQQSIAPFFEVCDYEYLNKVTSFVQLLSRVLVNRIFILREQRLLNGIYSLYRRKYLFANEKNGKRICAVCRKLPIQKTVDSN